MRHLADGEHAIGQIVACKPAPTGGYDAPCGVSLQRDQRGLRGSLGIIDQHAAEPNIDGRRPLGEKLGQGGRRRPSGMRIEMPKAGDLNVLRPFRAARQ